MNYMQIYQKTVSDGPGIRVSLYVSGCDLHCKGCHNPESWNFSAGKPFTSDALDDLFKACDHDYVRGLSILGGEPMSAKNRQMVLCIASAFKEAFPEKDLWLWTGYELDEIRDDLKNSAFDVAVVGRFILEQRDITSNNLWRGSKNQRVIDVHTMKPLEGIPNNA